MYRNVGNLLYLSIAGFASACGGTESDAMCRSDVALVVTTGTSPIFSWEPDCAVGLLGVADLQGGGGMMWGVAGNQPAGEPQAAIYSGVRYGDVPPGAHALIETTPLSTGRLYRVSVYSVDGRGVATSVGSNLFTP